MSHYFDRKQMETACYIEDMLYMYKPEMTRVLRKNVDEEVIK